jgi:hypothetical protein
VMCKISTTQSWTEGTEMMLELQYHSTRPPHIYIAL